MKYFNRDFAKFVVDDDTEGRLEIERKKENAILDRNQVRSVIKYGMKLIYLYFAITLISLVFFAYCLLLRQWGGVLLYAALTILWYWIATYNLNTYRRAMARH